jgi:hypothetical protein
MDSLSFDDVPFETESSKSASIPDDLSFDDVPMEATAPQKREAVPISAREQENDPDPFAGEKLLQTLRRRGQQFAAGATEVVAGVPEGAALANRTRLRTLQSSSEEVLQDFPKEKAELESIITEYGPKADQGDWEAKARVNAAKMRLSQVENQMQMAGNLKEQADTELATPVDETMGFQAGKALRESAETLIGKPDPRDTGFSGKLASGAGSMVAFVAATLLGGVAAGPAGGAIVGGTMGATSTSSQMYREAVQAGANEEDALKAAQWGALIGASEVVPILTGLKYIPAPLKLKTTNTLVKKVGEILESSGEEAVQEYLSQVAQNLAGYEDKPWNEGAAENALIGAILGGGVGAVGAARSEPSAEKTKAPVVEPITEKGANSAEAAALSATNQTTTPSQPAPVSPAAREPAVAKSGVTVGDTPPDVTAAVTLTGNTSQAPKPPVPGTGPGAAGEYIKQLARFREMERQSQVQSTAPGASSPAPVAEGPQAGGAPAVPPTSAPAPAPTPEATQAPSAPAEALQRLEEPDPTEAAPTNVAPVEAPFSPVEAVPDVLPSAEQESPVAPAEAPAAPEKRKYRTVTRRDVLLDAGIPAEQYDTMKPKARDRMAADLRAKVQRDTGERLEYMDPAEREQALTKAWTEIQGLRTKAAEKAAADRAERVAKLPPKTQKAAEASKAKEGPAAEDLVAQQKAERQARINAYVEEQRQKAQEETVASPETGKPRILKSVTDEAIRQEAENAIGQREQQEKAEASLREAEARQEAEQERAASGQVEEETLDRASKEGKAETARRVNNKRVADEIIDEHTTNEREDKYRSNGPQGDVARNSILARVKQMAEKTGSRLAPDRSGKVLFDRLKPSADPTLAPNAAQMILWEARKLAGRKNPTLEDFDNFRSAEALLRAGMVKDYLEARGVEGDIASMAKATKTSKTGETDDIIEDIPANNMTPEDNLIARQEGDEDAQAVANDEVADQAPVSGKRQQVTSESNPGYTAVSGNKTAKVVEKVGKGRKKIELSAEDKTKATAAAKALTGAAKAASNASDRPKLALKQDTTVRSDKGNVVLDATPRIISEKMTVAEAMDRLDPGSIKLFGDKNTQKVISAILGRLKEAIPDLPIIIIPHSEMMRITNNGAAAYFDPRPSRFGKSGYIAISTKYAVDGRPRAHLVAHEGLHALFSAALVNDPELHELVTSLGDYVRGSFVTEEAANEHYGLTIDKRTGRVDPHEFLSEALSEPEFQEILRDTPIPDEVAALLRLDKEADKTVWGALRSMVRDVVLSINKALFGDGDGYSVLDAIMEIGGRLDKLGTEIRKRKGDTAVAPGPMSEVRYAKAKNPNVGELIKRGLEPKTARNAAKIIAENFKGGISDADLGAVAQAFRSQPEQKKQSYWTMLRDGGVSQAQAKEINDYLKAEVGKSVDPETVPYLIEEAIKTFGKKDTSESNQADTGVVPPYKEPPSPGMGPSVPKRPEAPAFKGKGESRVARFFRSAALKTMTLDFMRQKFGKLFGTKDGNPLDRFVKAVQRRDNIVDEFAEPLERAGVEFEAFAKKNPEEALEFAQLAVDASRLNVKLGKSQDNSHLGKNATKGLQGKKALDKLNARFENNLSEEGRELYSRLTKLYREAHNANVEALAYNILSQLDTKLSNSDLMDMLKRVVEGRLTEDDAKLINNNTVFRALERAAELKVLKGDYFPMMRYGDYVVTTTEKLTDPGWKTVPLKVTREKNGKTVTTSKDLPVSTEIEGNILRVQVDPTIRGSQTAAKRALREYAASHELTLQNIATMYRDRQTGKLVSNGEQLVDREYDTVYEASFQTEGVHFFESAKEAEEFRKQSDSHITSQVKTRRQYAGEDSISASQLAAIVNHIGGSEKGELRQRMVNLVENAVIAQMSGNRAQKRYLARRNVIGASQDTARAAFTFARAAGNYHATLRTAPEMRKAMQQMVEVEKASKNTNNEAVITDVMNEMRAREANIENPNKPMKWTRDIATLSYFDKLFSPAYSLINSMQPLTTTWPVLAGRYGWDETVKAMGKAYQKVGLRDTVASGAGNTVKATTQFNKSMIDTSDLIGSLRKNLGKEYEALIDEFVERGLLSVDTGLEIGSVIEQGRGAWGRTLHKVDRIGRQLPNSVEVLNRAITAVATYDLALQAKKSKQDAIQEAYNTVSNTQGDYRASNAPNWMKAPGLGWMLQFKKYALLQYQLMSDMTVRAFKDADPAERVIARKQLMHLVSTQALLAGTWGLPGLEIFKLGFMAVSMLAGGEGWDDEEYTLRKMIEDAAGKTLGSVINNGLLSTVTGLDFASRLSLADMITGLPPKSFDADGLMAYAGRTIGGAPGGTVVDWITGTRELVKADSADAREKAIQKLIPNKLIADSVSAYNNYKSGNVGPAGAAAQVFGLRTLERAETGRERGAFKRQGDQRKATEKSLTNDLRAALDRRDRAAELKAIAAIRQYNAELRRKNPNARPVNAAQIRKYWFKDQRK